MRLPRPSSDGLAMTDSRMRLQQCITSQSPNGDACPAKAGHSKALTSVGGLYESYGIQ